MKTAVIWHKKNDTSCTSGAILLPGFIGSWHRLTPKEWFYTLLVIDLNKGSSSCFCFICFFREWHIHRCTFSNCDTPRRTTFPVQTLTERHSSLSWFPWAASWSGPSSSSWLAGCWHQHTGPLSLCLPHQSRSLWSPEHSSLHSHAAHCFPSCPGALQEFLLVRYSLHLLHGNVWVPRSWGNTSCGLWCPADTLETQHFDI